MSIIEKALDKLEKKRESSSESSSNLEQEVVANLAAQTSAEKIALPIDRLKELGMITHDAPRSQIAEEYRAIKRPLLTNIEGKGAAVIDNANLLLVTSALPGEGKTFSAINLAMSIALEQDKTVLFIDADVAKASAGTLLGISTDRHGLIDLLQDRNTQIRDVILHTEIPNLKIIPAGQAHDRSTELLASKGMRSLMFDLSQRYQDRVIVFDSPPLLLTSEANVLAKLMGQIVFVVAAEQTSQVAVTEALSHLGEEKIIGMVLNKSRLRAGGKQYGYGYGYGHGYGYGYGYGRDSKSGAGKPE